MNNFHCLGTVSDAPASHYFVPRDVAINILGISKSSYKKLLQSGIFRPIRCFNKKMCIRIEDVHRAMIILSETWREDHHG